MTNFEVWKKKITAEEFIVFLEETDRARICEAFCPASGICLEGSEDCADMFMEWANSEVLVKMTRAEILEAAKKAVDGSRHGKIEDNFSLIADSWTVLLCVRYLEVKLTAIDVL